MERVAFSRCIDCTLLFANPAPPQVAVSTTSDASAILSELHAYACRYLARKPAKVLVVGPCPVRMSVEAEYRTLEEIDQIEGQFDLVAAFDVVDRRAEPLEVAKALRALVAQDGMLLISTASLGSVAARRERDAWPALRSKATWWFTVDTLQLMLTRAGFGDFAPVVDPLDLTPAPSAALRRFFDSNLILATRPVSRDSGRLLSVIVPVFNEASTVVELLDRVLAKTIAGVDIEVVIVESNSTDGSRAIVEGYADRPRVKLVLEDQPRGKGHAVRTGLTHARGEVVLFQDADLEYDVNDYDRLIEPLFALRRTFVLGSRHGATQDGWKIRHFGNQKTLALIMNVAHLSLLKMFNVLYDQKLFDPFTMYKVFRRDCVYGLTFECNRFDFDYEINIKLIRKGYQPIEIPVNYTSRSFDEGKKVTFFRDPPTWIRAMLRQRRSPLYSF